jgi:hypothetical protein
MVTQFNKHMDEVCELKEVQKGKNEWWTYNYFAKYDATYDGSGMNQISFGHIHHWTCYRHFFILNIVENFAWFQMRFNRLWELHNQAHERGLIFSCMSVKPKDETTMSLITKPTPISIGHFHICLGIFVVWKMFIFAKFSTIFVLNTISNQITNSFQYKFPPHQ